ncbi:hypothetical protein BESB_008210 [Besnoitia besnoiti]|uniref:Transmembrane protein n=1 Tax=Besnoitia besnoiti TaxID=94643 RepID=A0A2A9MKL3_BESBE|nr:hypothetical protein BESB_008210 [Besnoitia besnoiti]PFH38479.1 hypothetical protein BESB_008210 [Besnoitia besnoiti]
MVASTEPTRAASTMSADEVTSANHSGQSPAGSILRDRLRATTNADELTVRLGAVATTKKRRRTSSAYSIVRTLARVLVLSLVVYVGVTGGLGRLRECIHSCRASEGPVVRRLMDQGSGGSCRYGGCRCPSCVASTQRTVGTAALGVSQGSVAGHRSAGPSHDTSLQAGPTSSQSPLTQQPHPDIMLQLASMLASSHIADNPLQGSPFRNTRLRKEEYSAHERQKMRLQQREAAQAAGRWPTVFQQQSLRRAAQAAAEASAAAQGPSPVEQGLLQRRADHRRRRRLKREAAYQGRRLLGTSGRGSPSPPGPGAPPNSPQASSSDEDMED